MEMLVVAVAVVAVAEQVEEMAMVVEAKIIPQTRTTTLAPTLTTMERVRRAKAKMEKAERGKAALLRTVLFAVWFLTTTQIVFMTNLLLFLTFRP